MFHNSTYNDKLLRKYNLHVFDGDVILQHVLHLVKLYITIYNYY